MRKFKSTFVTVLICIICLGALVGFEALLVRISGLGKEFRNKIDNVLNPIFCVTCNGEEFYVDGENYYTLPENGQVEFAVSGVNEYQVEVLPNEDFDFYANGHLHNFFGEGSFTGVFLNSDDVNINGFKVNCTPNCYSVQCVLDGIYNETANVTLPQDLPEYNFKLVVTSSTGDRITIYLNQVMSEVDITLTPDVSIVF